MALSSREKIESELLSRLRALKGPTKQVERKTIGLIENIIVRGTKGEKIVKAKVDTGANRSSIDGSIIKEIGQPRIIRKVLVRTAQSQETRPLVNLATKVLGGEWVTNTFTVSSRQKMQYKVLLGRNSIIKMNVIIDPIKQVKRNLRKNISEEKKIITA